MTDPSDTCYEIVSCIKGEPNQPRMLAGATSWPSVIEAGEALVKYCTNKGYDVDDFTIRVTPVYTVPCSNVINMEKIPNQELERLVRCSGEKGGVSFYTAALMAEEILVLRQSAFTQEEGNAVRRLIDNELDCLDLNEYPYADLKSAKGKLILL